MASYRIEITATAEKQLKKLPRNSAARICEAIINLGKDPFPKAHRKLRGYQDVFRIRVGRYRILYSVEGRKLIVIILKIGHRKDVYR